MYTPGQFAIHVHRGQETIQLDIANGTLPHFLTRTGNVLIHKSQEKLYITKTSNKKFIVQEIIE